MSDPAHPILSLNPVPTLLTRTRAELAPAQFDFARPMRVSRAPGRLDVMGGIADYTGSLVCESTLDRAAAVVLQERPNDRLVQVFSFNLLDEHQPFTFGMTLDAIASASIDSLRRELSEPGRRWAGYLIGCLFILQEQGYIDLRDPKLKGLNLALLSNVPLGAGVSSSAAIEVATMMNVVEQFGIRRHEGGGRDGETERRRDEGGGASAKPEIRNPKSEFRAPNAEPQNPQSAIRNPQSLGPLRLAALCQMVENRVVGAPCGIMDQVTSCAGEAGMLLRLLCQPHELQPPLSLPPQVRAIGINSNVKHSVGGGQYGVTRCAAFMAHAMMLSKMMEMGVAAGKPLQADPMRGYLANLDQDDYKKYFRPYLPEFMTGQEFLDLHPHGTIDTATTIDPKMTYPVQHSADHHVLEARRVRDFVQSLERAGQAPPLTRDSGQWLDRAGHLMYASHLSYTVDAMLGAPECDLLVDLVRAHEKAGLYGAKITGGGSGGTVAVLCDISDRADVAIGEIMRQFEQRTGRKPEAFTGSSPGAWRVGTATVR